MATPKKPRGPRKPKGEPTKPRKGQALRRPKAWEPGEWPAGLDAMLARVLPPDGQLRRWDPGTRDLVVGQVAATGSTELAADIAGVGAPALRAWLDQGRADELARLEARQRGEVLEPTEHEMFLVRVRVAHAWWAGRHVARLEHVAERGRNEGQRVAVTEWLLTHMGGKLAAERVEHTVVGSRQGTIDESAQEVDDMLEAMVERMQGRGKPRPVEPEDDQD